MSPTELLEAIIGSLVITLGLLSAAFAALRLPIRDRAALWFGVFVLLYGVRLAGDSELVQPLFPVPRVFWEYLDASITYGILVPAGLFVEALMGPGWRSSLRWTWRALATYPIPAIAYDVVTHQPGAMMWVNPLAVTGAGAVTMVNVLRLWRGHVPHEVRIAMIGGALFGSVALFETLAGRGLLGPSVDAEPLAMLVFVGTLAYMVVHRALVTERRLIAVSRELQLAREIQQSILPRERPRIAGLDVAARYVPMTDVAGDLYDFVEHGATRLGVLVADVSGHGVPAALVASMVKVALAAEVERLDDPGQALRGMNRTLWGKFERAYVTALLASFDAAGGRLTYARAGHPPALVRRADGVVEPLDRGAMPLAFVPEVPYATAEVRLVRGDRVVLFTDGLLEAMNLRGEFFGDERLRELVAADGSHGADRFADRLLEELRRWIGPGAQLQDDVTLVVVDVR